jgi:protein-S-isoprenylcysteine O-methyltransferase Ste14
MTRTIAFAAWLAGIVLWYVIRYPFQRRARKSTVAKSFVDWREWGILGGLTAGLFVLPAVYVFTGFPAGLDRPFSPVLAWLGIAVLLISLWLFRRSHADLGRNWSASLKMREQHQLVTGGVYRYVRHPMYTSFFLLALAQWLLIPNWLAGGAGLLAVLVLYLFRVAREERMMAEQFGDAYRAYCEKTTRIIPWLL